MNNIEKYKKGWQSGGQETPCGAGSLIENTEHQRKWIPQIVEKYKIKTISDIGAGDLNWMSNVQLPKDVKYTPYDLVPRQPEVLEFDLLTTIPPKSDLIMCLWVLNHFPDEQSLAAMENIKKSGSKYLIITNTPKWNQDYITELGYIDMITISKFNAEIRFIKLPINENIK